MRTVRYQVAFAFVVISLLFTGCKSSQKVATVKAGEAKAQIDFFESMLQQDLEFNTLSARMNVDLNLPGKELSSRVDLKMVKDSAFTLSVQPILGIEMFRIEINRDSVKIIDRMNRRYVAENHINMRGQTPVGFGFYNLQALFINHIFLPGEQSISPAQYNRFQLKQEGSMAEVRTKDRAGLLYTFMADGEEKLLSTYVANSSESFALQWVYENFVMTEGQPFPMLMDVKMFRDGSVAGGIKMHFNRVQLDVPVQIDTPLPEKYKRITLDDILKSLKSPQ